MRPQHFALTAPSLSLLIEISQGPKTSKPTFVKGGLVSVRSGGEFAMCFIMLRLFLSTLCNLRRIL